MNASLIVAAAGSSQRFGSDKLLTEVRGQAIIGWTLRAVAQYGGFDSVIVVAPDSRWPALRELATGNGLPSVELVEGGAHRQDSVRAALARITTELTCVHDGARPLCPPHLFERVLAAAERDGAATTAIACRDSVKRVDGARVAETLDRSQLVLVQTPQAFHTDALRRAHDHAQQEAIFADDDCALIERLGLRVAVVEGDQRNFKVTTPDDIIMLDALLQTAEITLPR